MKAPMQSIEALSNGIASLVERTAPMVVAVSGRRGYPLSGAVWSEDVVVTTSRAVDREDAVTVSIDGHERRTAALFGRDPRIDLALLRVEGGALDVPSWDEGETVRVGELVLMLGRRRSEVRASLGIVSATGGAWTTWAGGRLERSIRTDAAPFRGFSGGPLLRSSGEVLGIGTAALTRSGSATIPTRAIRRTVAELIEHGRIRQGYLGIRGHAVRLPDELGEATGKRLGVMIAAVDDDGPAARAGLTMGDTLLEVAGEPVRHLEVAAALLDGSRIGDAVRVRFVRGGEVREIDVVVGERT
jgi:serine protease DegQ